jgi:hypothetical protein
MPADPERHEPGRRSAIAAASIPFQNQLFTFDLPSLG